jgi:hypothetical protein
MFMTHLLTPLSWSEAFEEEGARCRGVRNMQGQRRSQHLKA